MLTGNVCLILDVPTMDEDILCLENERVIMLVPTNRGHFSFPEARPSGKGRS
jgi:hypothetical protein